MLNIYYGRESIDKEKFIYEQIAGKPGKTLVMVPDQYTLEAEKQAFRLLHTRTLMDVEITTMSRLGSRLIEKEGGGRRTFIDKYGRQVLLAQILRDKGDQLQVFGGSLHKSSFIGMTTDFIAEIKQYNIGPEELLELAEGREDSLLYRKLSDLQLIYAEYEERIAGRYTDAEDLIDLYAEKIPESSLIRGASVWVYGFDSFTPKMLTVLGRLMTAAEDVNVFLTGGRNCRDEELFQLTEIVMSTLERQAELSGTGHRRQEVTEGYRARKNSPALETLEQELYAVGRRTSADSRGIAICQAANMYSEAESAAAFILHLLRDCGMRCRDIMVICNDQQVRGSIISRVFGEYGITLFDDKKRSLMNSPVAIFTVALLEIVSGGYRTRDVFKALKTGFSPLSDDEIETLENYAIKYRIKGSMWKRPFVRGQMEYGEEGVEEIEGLRRRTMGLLEKFEELYRSCGTVGEFITRYYDFLMDEARLGDEITELMKVQEAQGLLDLAEETAQVWGRMVGLFDQMAELMGEEVFDGKEFAELFAAGLSQIEIGVLPPTSDDILMGTMQRTRSGSVRAVIVLGANEGILPAAPSDEGLFSVEELESLASEGTEICKVERIRSMEEKMAVYRNLSKPSDCLWIGFSASDEEGRECRPSEIVDTILRIFPQLRIEKDVENCGDMEGLVGGRINTLRHLTKALQEARRGERIDSRWKAVIDWYRENDPDALDQVAEGLAFTNEQKDLPPELAELLYRREGARDLILSPSRLERFSRCPFSHFITYGLRPEERRIFEASSREIGDIYHKCLMEVSRKLDAEDAWDTVTEEQCRAYVSEIARQEASVYREGVFHFGNEERYKVSRIEDTCFHVCWALIGQVRAGKVRESRYEERFGRYGRIPAVEVETGSGKVYIEGIIDRLDILEDDRVKIVDYKTGKENFNIGEARGGYRLQLMLYLKAAQEDQRRPAGVFYFNIREPQVDLTGTEPEKISEKISKEMKKSFRLNGIMVDDDDVIQSIAGDFSGISDIVPLRSGKEGVKGTSDGFLLSDEEFDALQADVDRQIRRLCSQLAEGRIAIHPKKTDRQSPCTYCQYKGICRFDTAFPGCGYEIIR
ncbi:MAG: PD-(D/E)XK nuclease family protein [Emergencia sp.]